MFLINTTLKKRTNLIVAGLGLAQLVFFVGGTKAQEVKNLDEVVISTTKNNQKQFQTGKVVTIIDSVQLSRSAGRTIADVLNQQAGIQVLGAGSSFGKDKSIYIRGAAAAYTVVLMDGVLVSDPSSIGSPFDLKLLSVDQIEKIEILRGGQSTMYGSDAVAGVINIITKKKATKGSIINGVLSAGSYDTYKGSLGFNGKAEDFTWNIGYSHLQSKGFSEAEKPAGNTVVFDKDASRQDVLNANFGLQLDKGLTLNPFVRYSQVGYDYDDDAFVDAPNIGVSKNLSVGTNAAYEMGKAKFNLNYSYQNTERVYQSMFGGTYQGAVNLIDFYYNQGLGEKVNLLVGAENRNTNVTYLTSTGTNTPSIDIWSAYGSLFLHDLSVFNLEVGARYNKHSKYGENSTYTFTPNLVFGKNIKLFATVSSSFRAPALDMLFGIYGANLNLKPEKSKQLEAGVDFSFLANKLNLKVATYKRKITDAIVYGMSGYINQDRQEATGYEIEPSFKFDKFNLGAYYAYVDGKTISGTTVTKGLLRRPKFTYGLNAGYQATENFYLSANYKFSDKRSDTYFNPITFMSEAKILKAYGTLDVYAEYALVKKRLKFFVDLKNITGEKYTEIYGYTTMGFNTNAGIIFNF